MEVIVYLGIFGVIILTLIGLFALITYGLWKIGKIGKILSLSFLIFSLYSIYSAFYPSDSFYRDEFKYNIGFTLSKSAVFIDKEASYPDFHGDYFSRAIIQLNQEEFIEIKNKIHFKQLNHCTTPNIVKEKIKTQLTPIGCWSINKKIGQYFTFIMFSDQKTIYFLFNNT